ncbi:MAG: choice-of-anchor J domain-containing protein [candidate division WOR-3 bacterium]|nr:choice-of-anchor J domain-containing protein [candidate division WOR-3 bacterium]MCX7947304.1 choice-of-anchor J domain-containing protein [candidate division WOR-3 bacterium]MDW8150139.1 choice-of-anchor J domain-containing protein [candidate division WOR-3 bacterium]
MIYILLSNIIFSESFEGGSFPPTGWVKLDLGTSNSDGWQRTTSKKRSGNYSAYVSYQPSANTKNEWLITPAINLSNYTKAFLIFYEDENWWFSYGGVHRIRISTTSQTDTNSFVIVREMTPANHSITGFSGDPVMVDISSFVGNSTVYIAFQYQGKDRDDWFIDDVRVFVPYHYDVKPVKILNPKPFVGSNIILPNVQIMNYGVNNLTNIPVRLIIRDFNNNIVYNEIKYVNSLNSFEYSNVSFPQFTGLNNKIYKLEVITELQNDQDRSNDTIRMNAYTYITSQKPLFERFTNTSCGPCGPADNYMHQIYQTYLYNVGIVVYHTWWPSSSDPMYVYNTSQNQQRTNYYSVNAVPWAWINGTVNASSSYTQWMNLVNSEMNYRKTPILFAFDNTNSYVSLSGNGQIAFHINQVGEMESGNYKIRIAILEDSIYYSAANGTQFHPMTFRHLIEDNFSPSTNQNIYKTYTFTFRPDKAPPDNIDSVNVDKMVAVVFIQRDDDKSVWAVDVYKFVNVNVSEDKKDSNFYLKGNSFILIGNNLANLKIYDVSGKLLIDRSFNLKGKIEFIPKLKRGLYIYKAEIGSKTWEGKFLYY